MQAQTVDDISPTARGTFFGATPGPILVGATSFILGGATSFSGGQGTILQSKDIQEWYSDQTNCVALRWYPSGTYDVTMTEGDDDSFEQFRRCGSGAYPMSDADGRVYCEAGCDDSIMGAFDLAPQTSAHKEGEYEVGNGCQTVGAAGARMNELDGGNGFFFFMFDENRNMISAADNGDQRFAPVVKLFENTYCTGFGREFYASDDGSGMPLDVDRNNPYDYGFQGHTTDGKAFQSFFVYWKPLDNELVPVPGMGIKMMPFPMTGLVPIDQTSCVPPAVDGSPFCGDVEASETGAPGGKFIYDPFVDGNGDPVAGFEDLLCVSSFDRTVNLEIRGGIQALGMTQADVPDAYSVVDFAGCSTDVRPGAGPCDPDNMIDSCVYYDDGFCSGSSLPALNSFPLGSFFYNYFVMQGSTYVEDSVDDDGTPAFCQGGDYDAMCVTIKFFNCLSRDAGDEGDQCVEGNVLPNDVNIGPYYLTSTPVPDFCPGGQAEDGVTISISEDGDFTYVTGGKDGDEKQYFTSGGNPEYFGWPLQLTGYAVGLTECDGAVNQDDDFD